MRTDHEWRARAVPAVLRLGEQGQCAAGDLGAPAELVVRASDQGRLDGRNGLRIRQPLVWQAGCVLRWVQVMADGGIEMSNCCSRAVDKYALVIMCTSLRHEKATSMVHSWPKMLGGRPWEPY